MTEDQFSKFLGEKISQEGQFILGIQFIDVPGEGIVTNTNVNKDYFPGPKVAAQVVQAVRDMFMSEMQRIGAFAPKDIILQ